jgi:triphosphoribosyl-dephospho-CoA synthase
MSPVPDMSWLENAIPKHLSSLGHLATMACWLEATAPKAGNVHPAASFSDMAYADFYHSARVIGPIFDRAAELSIGQLVLQAMEATRHAVQVNTNLGTLLLLAPLSRAMLGCQSASELDSECIAKTLSALHKEDARQVYEAIRLANPGGIGRVKDMDVHSDAPLDLLEAMRAAADRDMIAAEYTESFPRSLEVAMRLHEARSAGQPWFDAICRIQTWMLAHWGDSLIVRRNGHEVDNHVRQLAAEAWQTATMDAEVFAIEYAKLDRYLREDGHQRNPGTTADLIAAGLFIELWRASLKPHVAH